MRGINKATLIGRIGKKDPIRAINDSKVCNFSVATTDFVKREEETTWHKVVCWGNVAEAVDQYMDPGTLVYIEGKIRNRVYESNGVKRGVSEILALIVIKLKDKEGRANNQAKREAKEDKMGLDIPF